MMPNYYYDAPPDFTPDKTVEIVVPMEQPAEWYKLQSIIDEYAADKTTIIRSMAIFTTIISGKTYANGIDLPYPRGARVGVREPWSGETCKHCGRNFRLAWSIIDKEWNKLPQKYQERCLCLECAIELIPTLEFCHIDIYGIARENIHWYTVTAVDVVQRKGQWVEKVTMRREV